MTDSSSAAALSAETLALRELQAQIDQPEPSSPSSASSAPNPPPAAASSDAWLAPALHRDLLKFSANTRRRWDGERPCRDEMIALLQNVVSTLWRNAHVAVFGSCAVDLATRGSDVDLVVMNVKKADGKKFHDHQLECCKQLALGLANADWVTSIKTIDGSATPIVTIVCEHAIPAGDAKERLKRLMGGEEGKGGPPPKLRLSFDVSFGAPGHRGLEAVRLVKEELEAQPLLGPIVLALKSLLEQKKLKRVFNNGCITSYGLFILAARFLRDWSSHANPRARADGADCSGRALLGFLQFFGRDFNPEEQGVALRHEGNPAGGYLNRQHPTLAQFRCDSLYLRDPIDPQNNVGSNAYRVHQIQRAIGAALGALEARGAQPPPPADREWQVLHELIEIGADGLAAAPPSPHEASP